MIHRRQTTLALGTTLAVGPLALALAQPQPFQEGIEYATLDQPVSTDAAPGQIEVIEFFWYSCPHCHAFEPAFEQWRMRQPKSVLVKRVPVSFREDFVPQQRMFYVLDALGKIDTLHQRLFQAIHVERLPLSSAGQLSEWAQKQGIPKADFEQTYTSFGVMAKARRATQLQLGYKVQGVPSLGVAGRYYTDGSMSGSMVRALQIVDMLIAQESSRKK